MSLRWLAAGLAGLLLACCAQAQSCRLAFDVGSSGIRAGVSGTTAVARADIDYLASYSADEGLQRAMAPTIAALRGLSAAAGADKSCERVAGGFSVWRLALAEGPALLVDTLRRIHADSGVPLLVIPQEQEGAYGYAGSRQLLGSRLQTSHILDIGGGSLQIAGERGSFGAPMGQRAWLLTLCRELRNEDRACTLQPLSATDLTQARYLLAHALKPATETLPAGSTLTAVSRPVSRGVLPALRRLAGGDATAARISRRSLSDAIETLAGLSLVETIEATGIASPHGQTLLSTLLLVEGVLQATGGDVLEVAEIELTNIPGLLADEHAFAWGKRYGCYLERLLRAGIGTYAGDPATCPSPAE